MIDIRTEIENFEKEKDMDTKKEIADLIIEGVNSLLNKRDNLESKAQLEITGDITNKQITHKMEIFVTENSESIEEELEKINLKLQEVIELKGYFNETITKLEDLLIYSKY